jgi:hypothetical protein
MRSLVDSWTIVLVGSWNTAIFHPKWIQTELLKIEGTLECEFGLTVGTDARILTYPSLALQVTISAQRLQVAPLDDSDRALRSATSFALGVLKELRHTPVRAIGFNLAYEIVDTTPLLDEVVHIPEASALADCGIRWTDNAIRRELTGELIPRNGVLNLTVRHAVAAPATILDFNYNYEAASWRDLDDSHFIALRAVTMQVLRAYGVAPENNESTSKETEA